MKTLIVIGLLVGTVFSGFAQGTVNFANGAAGVNAPFYYIAEPTLASGANYAGNTWYAMLFAGPAGTPAADLTDSIVSGSPAMVGSTTPGYFFGGARTISGILAGTPATLQIRIWSSTLYGSAYPASAGLDGNAPGFGFSTPITITLGGGAQPTPNMVGLGGATLLTAVPEPSVVLLALLGIGAAAFFPRRI